MISSPGIGSNLDVNDIVKQLMVVESLPLNALARQEGQLQAKLSLFGQLNSLLATFETNTRNLSTASAAPAYSVSGADASVLTASASSSASTGSHSVTVSQIAAAQRLVATGQTSSSAAIGSGSASVVTISFGAISGGSFDSGTGLYSGATFTSNANKTALTVNLDGTNNTLEGIRDAINALDSTVTASIVNDGSGTPYRLTLSTTDTGANNSLKIAVSGEAAIDSLIGYDPAATQNFSQTQAAADANFSVDGIDITSPSDTATDVISGITLNLTAAGSTTFSVAKDTSAISSALATLATSFSALNASIAESTGFEAILQGDRAPLYVQNRLRAALGESKIGISTNFSTLSQLGMSFERDGSLKFDDSKLQAALAISSTDVSALVAAFGTSLTQVADQLTRENGPLNSRSEGINNSIDDISDRREVLNRRLSATEIRLRAQFSALDTLLAGMLATSSYLEQQLENLPKITGQLGRN